MRPCLIWMALASLAGGGSLMAAAVAAPDALIEALPERALPELDAFLKRSLREAPTMLMRRWETEQAEAHAMAARAPMLPSARAYVSTGIIMEQRTDGGVDSDRTLAAVLYNAGISQPIFHWGALTKNYEVAKLSHAISARNIEETRRLLAVDLRSRYFTLVNVNASIESTRRRLEDLRRQLEHARKQVADGFAASAETSTIDVQITATEMSLQQLERSWDVYRRDLSRISGVPIDQLPSVVDELPKPGELATVVKNLAGTGDPALPSVRLQNAEDAIRAERLRYEIESTRLRPKLGLDFSVSQDNKNPDNNALGPKALITTWSAYATVNWQLFDGFSTKAAKRASLARLRVYEKDRDLAIQQEADERRSEVTHLQVVWRQLEQAEIGISGARGSIEAIEKDVKAGWLPAQQLEVARQAERAALEAVNGARANFYLAVATYLSNRGLDPAVREFGQ